MRQEIEVHPGYPPNSPRRIDCNTLRGFRCLKLDEMKRLIPLSICDFLVGGFVTCVLVILNLTENHDNLRYTSTAERGWPTSYLIFRSNFGWEFNVAALAIDIAFASLIVLAAIFLTQVIRSFVLPAFVNQKMENIAIGYRAIAFVAIVSAFAIWELGPVSWRIRFDRNPPSPNERAITNYGVLPIRFRCSDISGWTWLGFLSSDDIRDPWGRFPADPIRKIEVRDFLGRTTEVSL